jgi:hypothetical protein
VLAWKAPRAHRRTEAAARSPGRRRVLALEGRRALAHGCRRALTHGRAPLFAWKAPRAHDGRRRALAAGRRAHRRKAPALRLVGARPGGHGDARLVVRFGLVERVQAGHVGRSARGARSWSTSRPVPRRGPRGGRWGSWCTSRPVTSDGRLAVGAGACAASRRSCRRAPRGARPGDHVRRGPRGARWGLVECVQAVTSDGRLAVGAGARRARSGEPDAGTCQTRSSWREQGTTSGEDPERIRLPAEPVGS